jgi:hypothetical protein
MLCFPRRLQTTCFAFHAVCKPHALLTTTIANDPLCATHRYSDLGALQRDHDFADKAVRLHFDDCPNARSLHEVASFPAPSHVAILEAHLWTAIRAARKDKRWNELDLEGMVQVTPCGPHTVGVL